MKTRKLLAGVTVAAAVLAGGPAFADALSDLLTSQGPGPATIGFSDYEAFGNLGPGPALQVGSTNYGVLEVRSITVNGNGVFSPSPSAYLVGVYSGITVTSIGNGGLETGNSGGVFSIYDVTSAELGSVGLNINTLFSQGTSGYTAGCVANTQCYNGITNVGATDVLNYALVPGADLINPADTLQATINGTSFPPTGEASGYGVITGGADAGVFAKGGLYNLNRHVGGPEPRRRIFCPNGSNSGQCVTTVGNWSGQKALTPCKRLFPNPVRWRSSEARCCRSAFSDPGAKRRTTPPRKTIFVVSSPRRGHLPPPSFRATRKAKLSNTRGLMGSTAHTRFKVSHDRRCGKACSRRSLGLTLD